MESTVFAERAEAYEAVMGLIGEGLSCEFGYFG